MEIRRLAIRRFRGIRQLDWDIGGRFVCLVGPGDSTKTTILDAIELALTPRWTLAFDDIDFFESTTDQPIVIQVTVGDLPETLISEQKFGLFARGWSPTRGLHDEPEDDDDLVLTVQLSVDESLEPSWAVVNDRAPEGKPIGSKDREKLGCLRVGEYLDRHFAWGRGSTLSRLTDETGQLSITLANAGRAAREAVVNADSGAFTALAKAAKRAMRAGVEFGVSAGTEFSAGLDANAISVGVGGLSLHDGKVPLRRAGLGTRRLLAAAMQWEIGTDGGITLVDEVENGLEPHRVRHLLRVLSGAGASAGHRQVFCTTHSPVALQELDADSLNVVRSQNGMTTVRSVPKELQPIVQKTSEAFLAIKVLVCEGRTELGFCRSLDAWWTEKGNISFGYAGIAIGDGGGGCKQAPAAAKALAELGYDVAYLGDSDEPIEPSESELGALGVSVFLWADGVAIEQRACLDLPIEGLANLVKQAMELWETERIRDAIAGRAGVNSSVLADDPTEWFDGRLNEKELRLAIGTAAKSHTTPVGKGWFKSVYRAAILGRTIIANYESIDGTDLRRKIDGLGRWAHSDG